MDRGNEDDTRNDDRSADAVNRVPVELARRGISCRQREQLEAEISEGQKEQSSERQVQGADDLLFRGSATLGAGGKQRDTDGKHTGQNSEDHISLVVPFR